MATKRSPRDARENATPGFAIQIKDDTDLGLAILTAEDEEGTSEPVAVVVSINEGREIATGDLAGRQKRLDADEDPGLCPYEYKVWARGLEGDYRVAKIIPATSV